jgi:6-phosphogluconate dehydrogenase
MAKHDIGLIGLAVMGQNLVMNMANKGFNVAVYNRTTEKMTEFVEGLSSRPEGVVEEGTEGRIHGYETLEDFVNSLESPRRVMMMVQAGGPCDAVTRATSLSTAVTPISLTPIVVTKNCEKKVSASSVREYPAEKKVL